MKNMHVLLFLVVSTYFTQLIWSMDENQNLPDLLKQSVSQTTMSKEKMEEGEIIRIIPRRAEVVYDIPARSTLSSFSSTSVTAGVSLSGKEDKKDVHTFGGGREIIAPTVLLTPVIHEASETEIKAFLKRIDPSTFKDMSLGELVPIYKYSSKEDVPNRCLRSLSLIKEAVKPYLPQKFTEELNNFKKEVKELSVKPWFGSVLIKEGTHYNWVKALQEKGIALKDTFEHLNRCEGETYLSKDYELNDLTAVLGKYLSDKKQLDLEGRVQAHLLRYKSAVEKNMFNQLNLEEINKWLDMIKDIHKEYAALPQGQIPERFKQEYKELFTTLNKLKNNREQYQIQKHLLNAKEEFHQAIRTKNVPEAEKVLEKFRKIVDHKGKERFIEWACQQIELIKTSTSSIPVEDSSTMASTRGQRGIEDIQETKKKAEVMSGASRMPLAPSVSTVTSASIVPQMTEEKLKEDLDKAIRYFNPRQVIEIWRAYVQLKGPQNNPSFIGDPLAQFVESLNAPWGVWLEWFNCINRETEQDDEELKVLLRHIYQRIPDAYVKEALAHEFYNKYGKHIIEVTPPVAPQEAIELNQQVQTNASNTNLVNSLENAIEAIKTQPSFLASPIVHNDNQYVYKTLDEVKRAIRAINQSILVDPYINIQKTINDIQGALHNYVRLSGIKDKQDPIMKMALEDLKTLKLKEVEVIEEKIRKRQFMH